MGRKARRGPPFSYSAPTCGIVTPITGLWVSPTKKAPRGINAGWLPAPKLREYYVDPAVGGGQEAQRVLYLAVVTGQVRARLNGRILRLDQIALETFSSASRVHCKRATGF